MNKIELQRLLGEMKFAIDTNNEPELNRAIMRMKNLLADEQSESATNVSYQEAKPQAGAVADKLKPCPFCGEQPRFNKEKGLIQPTLMWQIYCEGYKCEIKPRTDLYKYKKECLADWNKRATASW